MTVTQKKNYLVMPTGVKRSTVCTSKEHRFFVKKRSLEVLQSLDSRSSNVHPSETIRTSTPAPTQQEVESFFM